MNKKLELLSPAGNIEIFKKVIDAGADAVYFGGNLFGARAYAKNFSLQEGEEALHYAHLFGKKAYLTVNTLLKNKEIEQQLYEYIRGYYEAGLDGVIVQDIGVLEFIKSYFPELPLHGSTQMTVANATGAQWLKQLGVCRVVPARELSIPEIKNISEKTGLEIEVFIHGALCMGYSGQCLMSSMIGGRSGNRGRCAQPCRLPYQLLDENGNKIKMPGDYLLSLKDLCGITYIKDLAEAGANSFKIEGRMKQIEYATGVVSIYRKYIDAYLEGRDSIVSKEDMTRLFDFGNRCGFTNEYFTKQNSKDMVTYQKPSHERKQQESIYIPEKKVELQGCFYGKVDEPMVLEVHTLDQAYHTRVEMGLVPLANKQPTTGDVIKEKLSKTGTTPFQFKKLHVELDENSFIPASILNDMRRIALEELLQKMTNVNKNRKQYPYTRILDKKSMPSCESTLMICCKTKEQFAFALKRIQANIYGISLEEILVDKNPMVLLRQFIQQTEEVGGSCYLILPLIFRKRSLELLERHKEMFLEPSLGGVVACSLDELGFLDEIGFPKEKIHLDHRIYTFSNRTLMSLRGLGYSDFCCPLELNEKEIRHRQSEDSKMLLYGRIPFMITANCQRKNSVGCQKGTSSMRLQDRYKEEFLVHSNCCFCYNEIYNSKIYNVIDEKESIAAMGFSGFRLDFTWESTREMEQVFAMYENHDRGCDTYRQGDHAIFTKGHFKRGVE